MHGRVRLARQVREALLAGTRVVRHAGGPEPNRGRTETTTTTGLAGPSPHATTRSRSRHQARPRKRSCRLSHLSRPDLVRLGVRKPRDAPRPPRRDPLPVAHIQEFAYL
jgi:hypothetical protein